MELNIFKYSPKELSTDAFLNYFFLWAQENGFLEIIAEGFLVYSVDKDKSIKNLKVERQVSFGKKKADLVVDFELDGNIKSVLFENKTHTTTSQAQLSNYKKGEKKYKYNYLKLGYINKTEEYICKDCGYDIIDAKHLYDIIVKLPKTDQIINQYRCYLKDFFISNHDEIKERYINSSIPQILYNKDAQLYLSDKISESMGEFEIDKRKLSARENKFHIQYSSNTGGSPWTEIVFIEGDSYPDAIFWRIDKRSNKYYIRLNQYSYSKNSNSEIKTQKLERLNNLRRFSKDYFDTLKNINQGSLSNQGENEREIIIFFFENNDFKEIINQIPKFTKEFKKFYAENYENH